MKKFYAFYFAMIIYISCSAQKEDLRLKLEVGKEYKQLSKSKATISQEINGKKYDMVMVINGSVTYLVKSYKKDEYHMEVKYDSLSMIMQLPQRTMLFSSEKNDEKDIFSLILRELKNKPFELIITERGKVKEVKNIDSLFNSAMNKFSNISPEQLSQIKAQMMKAYGPEAFKGSFEMVTFIFPDHRVYKGESWIIKTKLESGMSGNVTTTYTYKDKLNDYFHISGDSKIETADKDAYVQINGMPTRFNLTGSMLSDIKVDKKSGWITEAKTEQVISGEVHIKENAEMPNGMTIPMDMRNEMVITNK